MSPIPTTQLINTRYLIVSVAEKMSSKSLFNTSGGLDEHLFLFVCTNNSN